MRQEFPRILESAPLWDPKVCVLQVSDATRTDHADTCLGQRVGFLESLGSRLLGAREINQVSTGEIPKQLAESPGRNSRPFAQWLFAPCPANRNCSILCPYRQPRLISLAQ
jgi:hypothetical protein